MTVDGEGADQAQQHRQEHQPVVQPKGHHEEENLEEAGEDVRLGGGEEDESEEGGDAAVEDGRADVGECGADPLLPATRLGEEAVHDVGRIIHTQACRGIKEHWFITDATNSSANIRKKYYL